MRSFSRLWKALGGTGQTTGIPPNAGLGGPFVTFPAEAALGTHRRTNFAQRVGVGALGDFATLSADIEGWHRCSWSASAFAFASAAFPLAFIVRQDGATTFRTDIALSANDRNARLILPYPIHLRVGDLVTVRMLAATIAGDDITTDVNLELIYQE